MTEDTLLIGFDRRGDDEAALVVSRTLLNNGAEIVNCFWGKEAIELHERLVTWKGGTTK